MKLIILMLPFLRLAYSSISGSSLSSCCSRESFSSNYDSNCSSSSSSSDGESLHPSDLEERALPEGVEAEIVFSEFDSGITLAQISELRKSFAKDSALQTLSNSSGRVELSILLENADIAANAHEYNHVFKRSVNPTRVEDNLIFASTLSFLRTKILGKYKGMCPDFSLSQRHLGFFAYLESGISLINQLASSRHSHKDAKKVLKFDFRNPRYTLDQLIQVTEKYGVVPTSLYDGPSRWALSDLGSVLNQFIRQAYLKMKRVNESDLAKTKNHIIKSLYRLLCIRIEVPPKRFTYTMNMTKESKANPVKFENVTPENFYSSSGAKPRRAIIQFGSDPTLEFHKKYTYPKQKCLSEGVGFSFINVPIEEMNQIAIDSIMKNGRIAHFTHYFSGHESVGKRIFDRNLFLDETVMGLPIGLNRADTFKYDQKTMSRSSGILWSILFDEEKNVPIQWKLETPFGQNFCVRNNYFLENGLTLAIDEYNLSPEISRLIEEPATIIESKFSKLA